MYVVYVLTMLLLSFVRVYDRVTIADVGISYKLKAEMTKINLNKIQKITLYASIPLLLLIGASYFYNFDVLGWLTYRSYSQEERDRCLKEWEARDINNSGKKFRFTPTSCNSSRPKLIFKNPVLREQAFKEALLLYLILGGIVGILLLVTKDAGTGRRK